MEDTDGRLRLLLLVALGWILVGGVVDLVMDEPESWLSFHVIFESIVVAGALLFAIALWVGWRGAERTATTLRSSLEDRSRERDEWRERARRALEGLGDAIDEQFDLWALTPAEREVALLVLKGHSHKRIARLTGRSEATVRQHAAAVYRKSGLGTRAELSAFFLADLMLPHERG